MAYKPRYPGDKITQEWTYSELLRIADGMYKPPLLTFDRVGAQPDKPREGILALANGFTWNPTGSLSSTAAAGLHIYLNGAWQRIAHGGGAGIASVRDFGATGDGSTDDRAAIQAALSSPILNIYFPPGFYVVSGSMTSSVTGKSLIGFNPLLTRFQPTNTGDNVLVLQGPYSRIQGIGFLCPTMTAGYALRLEGSAQHVDDLYMEGFFNGIYTQGAANRVLNSELRSGRTGGTAIFVTGGDTSQIIDNVLVDSAASTHGVFSDNNAALIMSNSSILQADNCLVLAPGSGQNIFSNRFISCFFDTATNGIQIIPSATSGVYRTHFVNCWTGSHTGQGINIAATGASTVDGIHFLNHESYLNGGNGALIDGSNVANVQFSECRFAANGSAGISLNGGARQIRIHHNHFGTGYGLGDNSFGDIFVAVTISGVSIMDNTLNHPTNTISLGSDQHVARNRGYNTKAQGRASISAAGTTVVVSTGIARAFSLGEVSVTPITAWGAATEFWVNSISGSTMVINVDVAPGASVDFVWTVDTEDRNL